MGGERVDLLRTVCDQRGDRLDERAGGVDLVVDDHRVLALDLADDVHQLGLVLVAHAPLLDDGQRRPQDLGEVARLLGESELADHDHVVEILGEDVARQDVDRRQLVDRDREEALDLSLVQVHGQHPVGSGHGQHVRDEPRGDRDARLVLLVGPSVAVERHDRRDTAGRRALEGVDHDQQLHDRLIHRAAGWLDQEHVLLAHVLEHAHEDVLVGELEDLDVPHARLQVAADVLRQWSVRVSGVDAELVGVHVPLPGPISRE